MWISPILTVTVWRYHAVVPASFTSLYLKTQKTSNQCSLTEVSSPSFSTTCSVFSSFSTSSSFPLFFLFFYYSLLTLPSTLPSTVLWLRYKVSRISGKHSTTAGHPRSFSLTFTHHSLFFPFHFSLSMICLPFSFHHILFIYYLYFLLYV